MFDVQNVLSQSKNLDAKSFWRPKVLTSKLFDVKTFWRQNFLTSNCFELFSNLIWSLVDFLPIGSLCSTVSFLALRCFCVLRLVVSSGSFGSLVLLCIVFGYFVYWVFDKLCKSAHSAFDIRRPARQILNCTPTNGTTWHDDVRGWRSLDRHMWWMKFIFFPS